MRIFTNLLSILDSPFPPGTSSQPLSYPGTPFRGSGTLYAGLFPSKALARPLIRLLDDLTAQDQRAKERRSKRQRALGLSSCGPFKKRTLSGPAGLTDPSFNRNLTWTSPS